MSMHRITDIMSINATYLTIGDICMLCTKKSGSLTCITISDNTTIMYINSAANTDMVTISDTLPTMARTSAMTDGIRSAFTGTPVRFNIVKKGGRNPALPMANACRE